MSKTFYQRYGYDVEINIGSLVITTALTRGEYGLCDKLSISRQENTASEAIFSFIPPEDIIDLSYFQGLPVTILERTPTDGWQQVFTGFVDIPSLDFDSRKVTLICTDDRDNRIITMNYDIINQIGYFNETIFGTPKDQSEELSKRLETVTANFDFDRFGNPQLTPWLPKTVADFSFTSADILQLSNPSTNFTSRKKTINAVNLTFKYNYQRLHQQCVNFTWPGYDDFIADWFSVGKPSFPQRSAITSAATSGDWKLVSSTGKITFVDLWPAGGYGSGTGTIIWQPNQVIQQTVDATEFIGYLKDSTGNLVTVETSEGVVTVPQYAKVLDASGVPVKKVVSTTIIDTSSNLCRGASWTSAIKFSQNITETYYINISASQSVEKFGYINQYNTYSFTDKFDTSIWENSKIIGSHTENFFIDQANNRADLNNALQVAYYKAKHDILKAHRDIEITFKTKTIKPLLDLIHTVSFTVSDPKSNTSHITTKGKISSIRHDFDFNKEIVNTFVTLAISKAEGESISDNFFIDPPVQNPGYIGEPQTIVLQTHLGLDPDPQVTPNADKWNGYIGNKEVGGTNITTQRTKYPETFIVDFPAIPDNLREPVEYVTESNLNIAIPNDDLETST